MTSNQNTPSFEDANGVHSYATMQLSHEARAWAKREGCDLATAVGFGRWYVRFTDGTTPLAAALDAFLAA